jgi:hypothetical protein
MPVTIDTTLAISLGTAKLPGNKAISKDKREEKVVERKEVREGGDEFSEGREGGRGRYGIRKRGVRDTRCERNVG